jgi:hypothetical protein
VGRLSRKCGSFDISQSYGHPQPITGIALLFLYVDDVHSSQETHLWASTACYGDSFTSLYVYDVHSSQETHLWSSTACYGDTFTFSYVDDRTSQETHLWASTACYGDSFTCLYVDDARSLQETYYGPHGLLLK